MGSRTPPGEGGTRRGRVGSACAVQRGPPGTPPGADGIHIGRRPLATEQQRGRHPWTSPRGLSSGPGSASLTAGGSWPECVELSLDSLGVVLAGVLLSYRRFWIETDTASHVPRLSHTDVRVAGLVVALLPGL